MNFLQSKIYHNTLEEWLIATGIIAASVILARVIYWLISGLLKQFSKQAGTGIGDLILQKIDTPVALGIILIGTRIAIERLDFSPKAEEYIMRWFVFMSALSITWLLARIARAGIEHYFNQQDSKANTRLDRQMMMLVKRVSVISIWLLGFIVGLNNAGFNVGALIAGLGIGGLAIALAAQDTVKNIIGGLIVFVDRPFKVGDHIKLREIEGTVLYIGIRSSRLRTPAGRVITLPNSQFSDNPIENITVEPNKRVVTYLSLVYDTSTAKIDEAIAILNDIATTSPFLTGTETLAFLEKFNQSSIDLNFTYHIRKDKDIFLAQTEVNKLILARFKGAGIEFAFPTQTVFNKN